MSRLAECKAKDTFTKEGIRISGHEFVAEVAFYDEGTDRTYFVDQCEHCNKYEVLWIDGFDKGQDQYAQIRRLGGDQ